MPVAQPYQRHRMADGCDWPAAYRGSRYDLRQTCEVEIMAKWAGWLVLWPLWSWIPRAVGRFVGWGLSPFTGPMRRGYRAGKWVRNPDALKRCPQCAENVKADAEVCRYCGHSFA